MRDCPKHEPNVFPASRAFVIQFAREPDPPSGELDARVEHVQSGRHRRVHSVRELIEFTADVLAEWD